MPDKFQLGEQHVIAFIATADPDRAKKFYRDTLGLRLVSEELPFALVFDAHGTMLRVTIVKKVKPAGHTVLGWSPIRAFPRHGTRRSGHLEFPERRQGGLV